MKQIRKGVAAVLAAALWLSSTVSVMAAAQPPELSSQETPLPAVSAEPSAGPETSAEPQPDLSPEPDEVSEQSMELTAQVPATASVFSVTIPEGITLGTLDPSRDFRQSYILNVRMPGENEVDQVTVTAAPTFPLYRISDSGEPMADRLTCHNDLTDRTFPADAVETGNLTIRQKDIADAVPGHYEGVLNFKIRYQFKADPVPTARPTAVPEPTAQPTATPAPTASPTPSPSPSPTPSPSPAPTAKPGSLEDGYYQADVSMRHISHFDQLSMCNKLFYPKAEIEARNGRAKLTLYVIDPVPQFPQEGTPVSNMVLHYGGTGYPAQIRSGSKVTKHFAAAPGFIDKAGDYPATPVTVELPAEALNDSLNQKLTSSAYVNAVMHTDVEFYVVLSNLSKTGGPAGNKPAKPTASPKPTAESSGVSTQLTMDEGEKTWYSASASMRKESSFDDMSMCDPLFFASADILYQGDTAQLTLYVIDPVPKFADAGTPLSDVAFLYDGKSYAAQVDKAKVMKHFDAAPGFIETAGDYPATPVRVVLPREAIQASKDGKLLCSAYINAVMQTTQKFYVVLEDLTETEEPVNIPADSSRPTAKPLPSAAPSGQTEAAFAGSVLLDTQLFPAVLGFVLLTCLTLGAVLLWLWLRRR